jgi:hypothetical protein
MLYGEKFALCSEILIGYIDVLCGHSVEFVNVKRFET